MCGFLLGGFATVIPGFPGCAIALLGLVAFVIMHVVMVIVHWREFPEMITGGKRAEKP